LGEERFVQRELALTKSNRGKILKTKRKKQNTRYKLGKRVDRTSKEGKEGRLNFLKVAIRKPDEESKEGKTKDSPPEIFLDLDFLSKPYLSHCSSLSILPIFCFPNFIFLNT
jgi:hypothetical protein